MIKLNQRKVIQWKLKTLKLLTSNFRIDCSKIRLFLASLTFGSVFSVTSSWSLTWLLLSSGSSSFAEQIASAMLLSLYFSVNWDRVIQTLHPYDRVVLFLESFKYNADFFHSPWQEVQASLSIASLSWPHVDVACKYLDSVYRWNLRQSLYLKKRKFIT